MNDENLNNAIFEIRDLLRLIAEPQIAERDRRLREELIQVVGSSSLKKKAVLAMDGSRTQLEIRKQTSMDQSNLSKLVRQLIKSGLLLGDPKTPNLAISVPTNFFS